MFKWRSTHLNGDVFFINSSCHVTRKRLCPLKTCTSGADHFTSEGGGGVDQKIAFIFSSDFKTMFTKHFLSEILNLSFEKKTLFKLQFSDSMVRHSYTRKDTMMSSTLYSQPLECSVWTQLISYAKHEFKNLKVQNSCATY